MAKQTAAEKRKEVLIETVLRKPAHIGTSFTGTGRKRRLGKLVVHKWVLSL